MKVTWVSDASRDLNEQLRRRIDGELSHIFAQNGIAEIIVKQRFRGFTDEPEKKLIIAVETQSATGSSAHVVKLGNTRDVSRDCAGWHVCAVRRGVASRMFIAPVSGPVSEHRQAVIYSDVYQYYYDNGRADQPKELESIVSQSILSNVPTYSSIERVLTQIFTEAYRCFYHNASEDGTLAHVEHALKRSLRIGESGPVFALWKEPEYLQLRRGAAWLTCARRAADSLERPSYVDPVDYIEWTWERLLACQKPETQAGSLCHLPKMLFGPAHGDLHGRNVIVGTVRGEAEWPAVFDFDKMSDDNLVAWDFAKLELELKCRLFQQLIDSESERDQVRSILKIPLKPPFPDSIELTGAEHRAQQRAEIMEIMVAIELVLDDWTKQLSSAGRAIRHDVAFSPSIPADTPLGRAMCIIFRIRREAAIFLGFERGRENRWCDEYYFALATYGVVTAKWHSADDHLAWALISAGVACASLTQLPWPPEPSVAPSLTDVPSYLCLLPYTHRCWKENRAAEPIEMLRASIQKFPYAVALRQQLALSLASSHNAEDEEIARREIESLAKLACVFRDHETLCRLGRIYKDRADRQYDGTFSHAEMIKGALPSFQNYQAALKYYRLAFDLSQDYYPGINAATLALLVGDHDLKERLANQVLTICAKLPLDRHDQTWILATEGEASLLLGRTDRAVQFYRSALDRILPSDIGVIQSIYDQLCRLHWVLGPNIVQRVVDTFNSGNRMVDIKPGPFGNCGG